MDQPGTNKNENLEKSALTSIHGAYTLCFTQSAEEVMIINFYQTLAEISLAVASRKIKKLEKASEQCER